MKRIKSFWDALAPSKRRFIKPLIGVVLGGALGYAYYATVGCSTGGCPITSNPAISTFWGAAIGGFATAG